MKTLLRVFLFALTAGIGIGWFLAEQQRRREEQAAALAFENNPNIRSVRRDWALEDQISDWLEEIEDENP